MIRERSDRQVLTSATQMDSALDGGLPSEDLAALHRGRSWWQATGQLPADDARLEVALGHPAAPAWDAVFVTAARKLSAASRNVRP